MIDPNAPAYPNARAYACGPIDGMTIRATMAMHAMTGILASDTGFSLASSKVAEWARETADALIAELNKEKP